jgi:cytochrome P450
LELAELGECGTIDAFGFARRVGHRLGLACWIGDDAAVSPWFERLVAELDQLDGADAFVHPDRMPAVASEAKASERAALARVEVIVRELLADGAGSDGFLREIAGRWADTEEPDRTQGIARDVVLLHVATMTNLFAALGWTLALLATHPDALERVRSGDAAYRERCALEAIRIGQCSVILRAVLRDVEIDDGQTRFHVARGVTLATMLALTNTTALPGFAAFDPDRWDGRRLRAETELPAREAVTTFGFGPHRCPAQRFSLSAITRVVHGLTDRYDLVAQFASVRAVPEQIGGVARAADPCPIAYALR